MALVVICGQPCSGKSTAALCLAEALKESNVKQAIRIIDETSFHLDRNQSYANMPAEKNLRGVLRSEVDRSVSRDSIVIVDSLNRVANHQYFKVGWPTGASEASDLTGIRYCVLYCGVEETHAMGGPVGRELSRQCDRRSPSSGNGRASEWYLSGSGVANHQYFKAMGGPLNGISLGQELPTINISRSVGLPELQRLRRTFIKLTGQSGPSPPSDAEHL
ncbi:Protein KTI12-like protein, partial [Cucurbita argyrosperma subsp. sororia]